MQSVQYTPVGVVKNECSEPVSPEKIKALQSTIHIDEKYTEALLNIEQQCYIDVIFWFDRSSSDHLSGITYFGDLRGVFASRSPKRPNLIGVTTVKLLQRKNNVLYVEGLDAINNTPVLDIKCTDTSLISAEFEKNEIHNAALKSNPRIDIIHNIRNKQLDLLMIKAAQIHGHFCPGLAMGVMAACYAMNAMRVNTDGMEDLLAISETNSCFADGIQFVTGCTIGNNGLVYRDLGKTAFTLATRNGTGIRIVAKPESQQIIHEAFPDFQKLYEQVVAQQNHNEDLMAEYKKVAQQRAFGTLNLPFNDLFAVSNVKTDIPPYAAMRKSEICHKCGESVMETRTVKSQGVVLCYSCANKNNSEINGNGIVC